MANSNKDKSKLISTQEEVKKIQSTGKLSTTYPLAFSDLNFLLREELRPVRLQLELLKTELVLHDHNIHSTIVFLGSARIPDLDISQQKLQTIEKTLARNPDNKDLQNAHKIAKNVVKNSEYLLEATKLAQIISESYGQRPGCDFVVATGGGPSFMEAANRGAHEAGARSIALNITLPHEQAPNRYVTPELTFQFHYFAIRKMHFFIRAAAIIAFPGGYGTCDELFDALTLIQTQKMRRLPILLFSKRFWKKVVRFDAMVEEGTIDTSDLELFQYVETAEEAWQAILKFYHM